MNKPQWDFAQIREWAKTSPTPHLVFAGLNGVIFVAAVAWASWSSALVSLAAAVLALTGMGTSISAWRNQKKIRAVLDDLDQTQALVAEALAESQALRSTGSVYGLHGSRVNVNDGRWEAADRPGVMPALRRIVQLGPRDAEGWTPFRLECGHEGSMNVNDARGRAIIEQSRQMPCAQCSGWVEAEPPKAPPPQRWNVN